MIYLPIGSICHLAEKLKEVGIRKCAYPFDWMGLNSDKTTFFKLILKTITMNELEIELFLIDFFDTSNGKNDTFIMQYNNKTVFRNTEYNISFPHDDIQTILEKYIRRWKRLVTDFKNNDNIVLLFVSCVAIDDLLYDFFDKMLLLKPNIKLFCMNGLTKVRHNYQDKITLKTIPYPFSDPWTNERIQYDQKIFKNNIGNTLIEFKKTTM